MKISTLFNIITDSSDILDLLLTKVENLDQLISRLERIRSSRNASEELLSCLDSLRASISTALGDTIEMAPSIDEPDEDDLSLDEELAGLDVDETQNPAAPVPSEDPKNDVSADK